MALNSILEAGCDRRDGARAWVSEEVAAWVGVEPTRVPVVVVLGRPRVPVPRRRMEDDRRTARRQFRADRLRTSYAGRVNLARASRIQLDVFRRGEYVEKDVLHRGDRMILIETSSQETYGATIRFYERSGYLLAARIRNFYRIGDDKLVFQKELV